MKSDVSHMLEKAGACGVATLVCSLPFFGFGNYSWQIPYTNTSVPLELLTFTAGTANSFVADGFHKFFHSVVPLGKKTADKTTLLSNAAFSGIGFIALLHLGGIQIPYQLGLINSFAIGAGSELVGSAVYEYLQNNLSF